MGKKQTRLEKLGSFEDFSAPWESSAGNGEIVPDKLKRLIFNLEVDKAKAEDAAETAAEETTAEKAKVTELDGKLAAAAAEASKNDPEGKVAAAVARAEKAEADAKAANGKLLRVEIAVEKGLTPKQAARLVGETKEELEADADAFIEETGLPKPGAPKDDDDDDDEDDDIVTLEREPQRARRLSNPMARDPKGGGAAEVDYEKVAAQIAGGGRVVL